MSADYRGKKIGQKLLQHTLDYAKKTLDINMCEIGCTSFYSANLCTWMGFKKYYELPYKDYIVDGKNPLLPGHPHNALGIFVKDLE